MDIDLEELAAIIELLDKTDFTQFRFEKGDLRIAVSRGGAPLELPGAPTTGTTAAPVAASTAGAPAPSSAPQSAPAAAAATQTPVVTGTAGLDLADHETLVLSPMLGTFYRSPKPGDPPFVEVGAVVEADAVLCIIEVMKLMTSVEAGIAGEVTRVFVSDGDLVEFDQPLFVIGRSS